MDNTINNLFINAISNVNINVRVVRYVFTRKDSTDWFVSAPYTDTKSFAKILIEDFEEKGFTFLKMIDNRPDFPDGQFRITF